MGLVGEWKMEKEDKTDMPIANPNVHVARSCDENVFWSDFLLKESFCPQVRLLTHLWRDDHCHYVQKKKGRCGNRFLVFKSLFYYNKITWKLSLKNPMWIWNYLAW